MKKTISIMLIMIIMLIGIASATINWNTDVEMVIPLFNTTGSETGLIDLSNNRNATSNGASFNVGQDAFNFNGASDYLAHGNTFFGNNTAFSICLWVNPDKINDPNMRFFDMAKGGVGFWIGADGSVGNKVKVALYDGDSQEAISTSDLTTTGYLQACFSYDGTSGDLYINGSSEDTVTNGIRQTETTPMKTGAFSDGDGNPGGSDFFDGEISDLIIFNRQLTSGEVSGLYAKGRNYNPYLEIETNSSTESTAIVKQVGSVSFVGETTIIASDFNVTINNTPIYGGYSFNIESNNNNELTCDLTIDDISRANVTRSQIAGELGSVFMQTEVFILDEGNHTQSLKCQRSSGVGLITVSNAVGIGHFLVDEVNITLPYNTTSINSENVSGSTFTVIKSFNITTAEQNNTGNLTHQIVVEGSLTYTNLNTSTDRISSYITINGTACAQYPRDVDAGNTGSVAVDCILQNTTANTTYQIDIYARGKNTTLDGSFTAKDLFIDLNEIEGGTGIINGTNFTGNTNTRIFNISAVGNFNHPVANAFLKASYSVLTDTDTEVTFYIRLVNGTNYVTNNWSRDYENGVVGVLTGHDIFENVPLDPNYEVELWANCGTIGANCQIVGGSSFGYITDVTSIILNAFNITTYNAWDNSTINNFSATNGATYNTTTGIIQFFTENDIENITISSIGYFNKTFLNHNTSIDINTSMIQSDIKFRAFEIITGDEVSPANFTIDGRTKGVNESFYLAEGSYNVTFSKNGWFNQTQEINITALDNRTINITGMSSSVLNLTVRNIINASYIQTFSGTISSPNVGYTDTFSTTNGNVLIPIINTQNFTIQLNTIAGMSDFNNSINITTIEITPPIVNRTIKLYTNNSINFTIRYFENGSLVNQPVNITMLGSTITYNLNTSNGTLYVDQRNDDTYATTISSAGFSDTTIFITLSNNAHQSVEIFLQSNLVSKSFIVKNNNLVPIDGATLTFNTVVNGTSIVVAQAKTDFSGRATVLLDETTRYQFTSIATGFDVFAGEVVPTENEYSITMIQASSALFTTQFDDVSYAATFDYNAGSTQASSGLFINSILGSLEYFGLTSTYNGTTFTQNISTNAGGGFPNITITGIDPTYNSSLEVTYFFKSVGNTEFTFTESYFLSNINGTNISIGGGLFSEVTDLEENNPMRGIIAMMIVTIGVLVFLGATKNMTVGVIGGLIGVGLVHYLELWPTNITIITIIVGIILIIADNIR